MARRKKKQEAELTGETMDATGSMDAGGAAEVMESGIAAEVPVEAPTDSGADTSAVAEPVAEPAAAELDRLRQELSEQQDRHLRLAAEFDNYRKRVLRQQEEQRLRAQADLARAMLESLDDLTRVSQLNTDQTTVQDVLSGVGLVERKLLRHLEGIGLHRLGDEGQPFDPNDHEAVSTTPAPAEEQDGLVASVFQPGYRLGGLLLRPARVQVFVAPVDDTEEEGQA